MVELENRDRKSDVEPTHLLMLGEAEQKPRQDQRSPESSRTSSAWRAARGPSSAAAGKPITKHQLARLLKPFKILPGTVKLKDGTTAKGYKRESFVPLWERYFQTVTSSPPKDSATFGDFRTVTMDSEVERPGIGRKPQPQPKVTR